MGAQLVRAELLKYPATGQPDKPTVLLDRSAGLNYVVQSGVVGAPNGQSFPTHQTPFRLVTRIGWREGHQVVHPAQGPLRHRRAPRPGQRRFRPRDARAVSAA
ncbi:hypothetical protein G6F59_017337 [Rhizopus arrhizus]|nr:hypothetical protein G6F59_017337 [Rhizopus arrhizus]